MIYKVTFHISTLYIYRFFQLKNYYTKQEKLIHDSFYIQETSYTQNGDQILHNGGINQDNQ